MTLPRKLTVLLGEDFGVFDQVFLYIVTVPGRRVLTVSLKFNG
jgi:hypothetical protein